MAKKYLLRNKDKQIIYPVTKLSEIEGIENKQDKLTAGSAINIANNVISVKQTDISYNNLKDKPFIPDISGKMDKENPTGIGSFSLNRAAESEIGEYSFTEGSDNTASGNCSHAEGWMTAAYGGGSHAEGSGTTAGGEISHAEGLSTYASGDYSHAEGNNTAADGEGSHAEGDATHALGEYTHAEGAGTIADGSYSHAEGYSTRAIGDQVHAEGRGDEGSITVESVSDKVLTLDSDEYDIVKGNILKQQHTDSIIYYRVVSVSDSKKLVTVDIAPESQYGSWSILRGVAYSSTSHAEGYYTTASGNYSHAEGNNTVAIYRSQHVFGEYNEADGKYPPTSEDNRGNYIEIVGNGKEIDGVVTRSNARTLDWNGNERLAGELTAIGGVYTNNLREVRKIELATDIQSEIKEIKSTNDGEIEINCDDNEHTQSGYISIKGGGGVGIYGNTSDGELYTSSLRVDDGGVALQENSGNIYLYSDNSHFVNLGPMIVASSNKGKYLKSGEDGLVWAEAGGSSSPMIDVATLPTTPQQNVIYRLVAGEGTNYNEKLYIDGIEHSKITSISEFDDLFDPIAELIYNYCPECEDPETAAYALMDFCTPATVNDGDTFIIKNGFDKTSSKFILYFKDEEVILDKQFDTKELMYNYLTSEEFGLLTEEIYGINLVTQILLNLNYKITSSYDSTSHYNWTFLKPNDRYFIFNGEQWIELKEYLDSNAEIGSVMVKTENGWKSQSGYGYDDEWTFVWDGDTTGLESLVYDDQTYYKVSDNVPNKDRLRCGYYHIENGGSTWLNNSWISSGANGVYRYKIQTSSDTAYAFAAYKDGGYEGVEIPKGFWLSKKNDKYVSEIDVGKIFIDDSLVYLPNKADTTSPTLYGTVNIKSNGTLTSGRLVITDIGNGTLEFGKLNGMIGEAGKLTVSGNIYAAGLTDGTTTKTMTEVLAGGGGTITDVKVNGETVVSSGIASINLKTVNGNSIVGTGDIPISSSSGALSRVTNLPTANETEYNKNLVYNQAKNLKYLDISDEQIKTLTTVNFGLTETFTEHLWSKGKYIYRIKSVSSTKYNLYTIDTENNTTIIEQNLDWPTTFDNYYYIRSCQDTNGNLYLAYKEDSSTAYATVYKYDVDNRTFTIFGSVYAGGNFDYRICTDGTFIYSGACDTSGSNNKFVISRNTSMLLTKSASYTSIGSCYFAYYLNNRLHFYYDAYSGNANICYNLLENKEESTYLIPNQIFRTNNLTFAVANIGNYGIVYYTRYNSSSSDNARKIRIYDSVTNTYTETEYTEFPQSFNSIYAVGVGNSVYCFGQAINPYKYTIGYQYIYKTLATTDYHDSTKQDTLVSGTNIKTINNTSILGSGNISISGDVAGPSSSTNNGIVTFNGTTGKAIKNNSITIDSDNKITGVYGIYGTEAGFQDGVTFGNQDEAKIYGEQDGLHLKATASDGSIYLEQNNTSVDITPIIAAASNKGKFLHSNSSTGSIEWSNEGELPAYPGDTDGEYILALKYENDTWVKYWKETASRSDIVDKGTVDSMVLKS